jgi:SAM-dependent methyltransferase
MGLCRLRAPAVETARAPGAQALLISILSSFMLLHISQLCEDPMKSLPTEINKSLIDLQEKYICSTEIHSEDYIFWNIYDRTPQDKCDTASVEYLDGGLACAKFFSDLISEVRPTKGLRILEFAAGFGRVTRHMKALRPECTIFGSDIHPAAVTFMKDRLNIEAFASSSNPDDFDGAGRFDVIYVISFFTHMPKRTWSLWLAALAKHLLPEGILIFTTHGYPSLPVIRRNVNLDSEGFWFAPFSEQRDLDTAEYGLTVTNFDFVHKQCEALGLRLNRFVESGSGYQDLYVATKPVQYSAAIEVGASYEDNGALVLPLTVTNTGSTPWIAGDPPSFTAGARLFDLDGVQLGEFRAMLPNDISPGNTSKLELKIPQAVIAVGKNELSIDIVKEQHFWFSDIGSRPAVLKL